VIIDVLLGNKLLGKRRRTIKPATARYLKNTLASKEKASSA
jgi:hypothetical protein